MVNKLKVLVCLFVLACCVGAWPSSGQKYNGSSPQAAPYTGPGDVVSGAKFWYSCQFAYSAAVAAANTQATCNIRRASDNHTCDVIIATSGSWGNTASCSTGGDNGQSASSFCTATTCSVTKAYDQIAGNNCLAGTTCDVSQSTAANQPTITFNAVSTNAAMTCNGTAQDLQSANSFPATPQPFTLSVVSEFTGASEAAVASAEGGTPQIGSGVVAGDYFMYAGAFIELAAAASAFHAAQGIFDQNGGGSSIYIDGTSSGVSSSGSVGWGGAVLGGTNKQIDLCTDAVSGGHFWSNYLGEFGVWTTPTNGSFSGGQQSSMNSNQHTRWGF